MGKNASWLFWVLLATGCGGGSGSGAKPDACKNSICGPASGASGGSGATGGSGSGAAAGRAGSQPDNTGGSANATGAQGGSAGTAGDAGADPGPSGGSSNAANGGSGATGGNGGSGGKAGAGATGGGATGGASTGGSSGGTAASGGSSSCQGDACGPVAALDMDFYECNVEPILDRSCAMLGCHGSEKRPFRLYARGRLRHDEDLTLATNPAASGCVRSGTVNLAEMGTGTIMCEGWTHHTDTEWQMNFASASSFMRENMSPDDSELLSQPTVGGLPHVNVHPFQNGDESYSLIRRWLAGETLAQQCAPEYN